VLTNMLAVDNDSFVVMLSGNAFVDDIQKAMKAGAKGFVAKPFSRDKVLAYVEKCKAKRGK
ncbi:MAG: response regulator, partial [Alphaproteobacteria bacterium]